jgi:nucleotide-binding universal stress UspA family protein
MYRRIIVPVDGSDVAEQVIPHVEALATAFGASVVLLWVTPPVDTVGGVPVASEERWKAEYDAEATPYLTRIEAQLRASGVEPTVERANGAPAQVIVKRAQADGADLIAMTTHGRSGIRRLALGSVAEEVVRHAECPVLLVRARE